MKITPFLPLILVFAFTVCDNSGGSDPVVETTNPNVTIEMQRGTIPLFAERDYIYFPQCTADGKGGSATPPLSFTVTNTGSEDMIIYRVEVTGTNAGDFTVNKASMDTTVSAGDTTSFTVSFDPVTSGTKNASVRVVTNAGNVKTYEIVARGTASPAPVNAANNVAHAFTEKTFGNLTVTPRGVVHGYLNPDGELRIIAGSGQNPGAYQGSRMSIFEPDSGSAATIWDFVLEEEIVFSTDNYDYFEPLVARDFDGDGLEELFCRLNGSPAFVKWNGTTYARCWEDESDLISCNFGAVFADVNRDGRDELITGTETNTCVYSWDEGFTDFACEATLSGGNCFNVGAADIDGDGFIEIAATDSGTGPDIYVYRFNGTSYAQLFNGTTFLSPVGYSGFAAVDIDGDYKAELVGGSSNWSSTYRCFSIFEWNGTALEETVLTGYDGMAATFQCAVGDFDRDGQPEVLADLNGDTNILVEMNGTGIDADTAGIDYDLFINSFDYDSDGFPELFVSDYDTTDSAFIVKDEI